MPSAASTIASSDLIKLERRRAQNRSRQLRYLKKKRQYESDVKMSVENLESEVQRLQLRLHQLQNTESLYSICPTSANGSSFSTQTPATNLQTARDLVHCFRAGFPTTEPAPWLPSSLSNQEQIRFVQQKTHHDILHNDLRGQNSFLEQWRRYTTSFGCLQLRASSFKQVTDCVCHVELTLSLRLVSASFQRVFPRLLQPQHSALLRRLSDQQINVPMTLQLQLDAQNRVVRCDSSLDFVSALRPLLSSYASVATALKSSHVSSIGHIGPSSSRDARLALSFVLDPIE